jgi:lipoteichoic acid synthase
VTRAGKRRGRGQGRSRAGILKVFFLVSLGLLLLALVFGLLSLQANSGDAPSARDGVTAAIPAGVREAITGGRVEEEATIEEEASTEKDASNAGSAREPPAANARLVPSSQTEKRNVVLVHLESARARSVTPYNEDLKTMPFLDELAKQSLVTERTHVIVPRSSKGSTAANCGVEPALYAGPEYERGGIPAPCVARLLEEQGYRTAWFQSF